MLREGRVTFHGTVLFAYSLKVVEGGCSRKFHWRMKATWAGDPQIEKAPTRTPKL
jgi:hypothetical protein